MSITLHAYRYEYIYAYIPIYIHIYIYMRYTCIHAYIHIHMHTWMHACIQLLPTYIHKRNQKQDSCRQRVRTVCGQTLSECVLRGGHTKFGHHRQQQLRWPSLSPPPPSPSTALHRPPPLSRPHVIRLASFYGFQALTHVDHRLLIIPKKQKQATTLLSTQSRSFILDE